MRNPKRMWVLAAAVLVMVALPAAASSKKVKKMWEGLWGLSDFESSNPTLLEMQATISSLQTQVSGLTDDVVQLQTMVASLQVADTNLNASLTAVQSTLSGHTTSITTIISALTTYNTRISSLESWKVGVDAALQGSGTGDLEDRLDDLETLLASASLVDSGNTLRFTGVNLQVVSGSGSTGATPNGLGNLFVGYNETRSSGNVRTGSHFIVVGSQNNFSNYGGLVVGLDNEASAPYSSVSGGTGNTASGYYSSIAGGMENEATNTGSSVVGGEYNRALGYCAAILGGIQNDAGNGSGGGDDSTIAGGYNNSVTGDRATVSGGKDRSATGADDWRAGTYFSDN